ncbi:hypothetical protein HORM4_1100037 [Vibrio harveyi]|nr:hypothetical protein HORM4_1100037 [Vibrio harveyi]
MLITHPKLPNLHPEDTQSFRLFSCSRQHPVDMFSIVVLLITLNQLGKKTLAANIA